MMKIRFLVNHGHWKKGDVYETNERNVPDLLSAGVVELFDAVVETAVAEPESERAVYPKKVRRARRKTKTSFDN